MKRRNFLSILTGIIAAPFVAKKAEAQDPRSEVTPEQWKWKERVEREGYFQFEYPIEIESTPHAPGEMAFFEEWKAQNGTTLSRRSGIFETQNTTLDRFSTQLDRDYAIAKRDLFDARPWYGEHLPKRF